MLRCLRSAMRCADEVGLGMLCWREGRQHTYCGRGCAVLWTLQVVEGVVQSLDLQGALEATLATASSEQAASLLQHVRRQLSHPRHVARAAALAQCLLASSPRVLAGAGVHEAAEQLRAAVADELQTQERLMVVCGMVEAIVRGM